MPYDRIQIAKPDPPANDADVGVQGKYEMPAKVPPCYAHITYYANKSAAGDKDPENMFPNLL
jgi:hypothetical protein